MTVPTNTVITYSTVGNREDLMDWHKVQHIVILSSPKRCFRTKVWHLR